MTIRHLEVVGPYIRSRPRTRLEEKVAFVGGFCVVGLCIVEWFRRSNR